MQTTVPVRLSPTPEQAATLRAHCQEYLSTVNVLLAALDSDVLPGGVAGAGAGVCSGAEPARLGASGHGE